MIASQGFTLSDSLSDASQKLIVFTKCGRRAIRSLLSGALVWWSTPYTRGPGKQSSVQIFVIKITDRPNNG